MVSTHSASAFRRASRGCSFFFFLVLSFFFSFFKSIRNRCFLPSRVSHRNVSRERDFPYWRLNFLTISARTRAPKRKRESSLNEGKLTNEYARNVLILRGIVANLPSLSPVFDDFVFFTTLIFLSYVNRKE